MKYTLGVDVGGTFTDLFVLSDAGQVFVHKTPSTPANPARAIVDGAKELCKKFDIAPSDVTRFCHGTTVATNALIQRRGGKVCMITTRGFKDVIEIARQVRPKYYDLYEDYPAPLVKRQDRFEITERVGFDGRVVKQIDRDELVRIVDSIELGGYDACAICLLFSYNNPKHERIIAEEVRRRLPNLRLSVSSEVQPEFREYERFSTTVLNGYLLSVMTEYMKTLEQGVAENFGNTQLGVNQSSGGLMSVNRAQLFPIRTALSGPAAGVVGAIEVARQAGRKKVITLDMGGTSADVALIRDYGFDISLDRAIEGFPVRLPSIDIDSVGAGGGSVAWLDLDGLIKVGPESAGSYPGPACYKRGGTKPTVSDANLLLGRLSNRGLLNGTMPLDISLSQTAIKPLSEKLGLEEKRTAQGILSIVVANMVRAVRGISVERGLDPREYTLLAFGGAGPLHASAVAHALNMKEILVPPSPGILCAQGLVVSDLIERFVRTIRLPLDDDKAGEKLFEALAELRADAERWLQTEELLPHVQRSSDVVVDMRYRGQNFELSVPLTGVQPQGAAEELRNAFFAAHERNYGFHNPKDPVEIVNLRLIESVKLYNAKALQVSKTTIEEPVPEETRAVYYDQEAPLQAPVYDRAKFQPGMKFTGPAIVEQLDATTVVFPGDQVVIQENGSMLITVN
ncbi:hydantoinase/oxoprolinase family protein [Mesorhizobium sp.]|uniref:hydantoinase/oxoprolinase family protein n=1 Tax=Mesorhizobium sp. TaxID=1871066 RepID=UPI000FE2D986|nr:hydantoinase/oxoprolinase family protein [Mesorhizobium sp.]RWH95485.1 MAG: hydantoinase/oxoprolinase family protein [Mesorhizobium sp.]RWK17679.1 MAG: hydantoinase/oxoprolinase family protein [Mesorhizobium sp.]RWK27585.1 MAG: hydantoinase/oxoprolinase family protein [Mesorhizobium sp.]RWM21392.1 MAG: hydantoinase/oxoprolinase family protein [Mesorhizobium sp.]